MGGQSNQAGQYGGGGLEDPESGGPVMGTGWGNGDFSHVRVAQVKAAAMPQTALQEPTTAVCFLGPCGIRNRMTCLVNFGESGKNFIEMGKRPKVQETMLRLAGALKACGISKA